MTTVAYVYHMRVTTILIQYDLHSPTSWRLRNGAASSIILYTVMSKLHFWSAEFARYVEEVYI